MAEKMAERIAEILKEPNFQTAEKALTDFCGPMDGEFRNLLVDIIVERWIDTPKDVPFSYARSIWNRKDINREEYQALLEEIRSYPIAPINKAKISDFLWVVENDFSNAKIAETAYYEHLKNTGAFADHIMAINRILFISKKIRSKEINEEVRKNLLIKVLEEYDNSSHAKIGYLIKTAMEEKVDTGYLIPYVENILKTYDDNSCDAPLIGKFCDLLEELYCRKNNWQKKKCITEPKLNVSFDLWKKESDAQPYIPDMVEDMKEKGLAYVDQGALVVDVKEESDTKEIPPCMLLKSDGASLYTTTDLATIVERMKLFNPDEILYVVDKRQELHFIQVFRCARKAGLVKDDTRLSFLGFGTMNGKDGKPFKTREGGVMRLETLIKDINEEMFTKIVENRSVRDKDAQETAEIVGLSAIKYGDLSNQATKDYIFDIDRFTSFEGNTGPYILYTIVRIKSILNRFAEEGGDLEAGAILDPVNDSQKNLMLQLTGFGATVENAFEEKAPHKICAYIYEVSNAFNSFYHETKILSEENEAQKASFIQLLKLTKKVLETCIDLLGFSAPDRM